MADRRRKRRDTHYTGLVTFEIRSTEKVVFMYLALLLLVDCIICISIKMFSIIAMCIVTNKETG